MKQWSSKFGFLMATLGAAVGLGNLWKFPYMCGQGGGALFIGLFIIFTGVLGLPLLLAEFTIGGLGRGNAITALKRLAAQFSGAKVWKVVGVVGTINLVFIMSFYSVIAGWAVTYLVYAFQGRFANLDPFSGLALFNTMMSSPFILLAAHTFFTGLTAGIIFCGVQKGIERSAKIMMPALLLILLIIIAYNISLPGFVDACYFMFQPNWTKISFQVILDAMGQAFFSLAVGAGCMCLYAAYQKDSSSLIRQSFFIAGANIVIALLAGLAIFPLVFSYGLNPEAGLGLIFQALPLALGKLPLGYGIGILLFILFLFAALTSSVSLVEPAVSYLHVNQGWKRRTGLTIVTIIAWLLGALYIVLRGSVYDIFDAVIRITSTLILPLTGLGFIFFAAYIIPKKTMLVHLRIGQKTATILLTICLRILSPLTLALVFLGSLLHT